MAAKVDLVSYVNQQNGGAPSIAQVMDPNGAVATSIRAWFQQNPSASVLKPGNGNGNAIVRYGTYATLGAPTAALIQEIIDPNVNTGAQLVAAPIIEAVLTYSSQGAAAAESALLHSLNFNINKLTPPSGQNALVAAPSSAPSAWPFVLGGIVVVGFAGYAYYKGWV